MSRFINLFLVYAPWLASLGGAVLVTWSVAHLAGVAALPGIAMEQTRPGIASMLLGIAVTGLGATYLLTGGATGHDRVYVLWLLVAVTSGLITTTGRSD